MSVLLHRTHHSRRRLSPSLLRRRCTHNQQYSNEYISCDLKGGGLERGWGVGLSPRQRRRRLNQSESVVSGEARSRAVDAETLGVFDTLNLKSRPWNEKANTAIQCRDSLLSHCPRCARLPASSCPALPVLLPPLTLRWAGRRNLVGQQRFCFMQLAEEGYVGSIAELLVGIVQGQRRNEKSNYID